MGSVSSALLGGPPDAEAWAAPHKNGGTTNATAIGSDPTIALMLVMAFFMGFLSSFSTTLCGRREGTIGDVAKAAACVRILVQRLFRWGYFFLREPASVTVAMTA